MEILLTRGADPKIVSRYGRTAIHYAAACGYEECLALLMQHGCDVNICPEGYPSPVISATMSRRSKCLSMLLDTGEADVNFVDKFGENAILEASNRGMESHAELLLQHGADVNSRSEGVYNRRWTPLMNAASKGFHGTVRMLIKHNAKLNLTDSLGRTAFSLAAEGGHLHCVMELYKAGCSVNLADLEGKSPLMYACEKDRRDVAYYLLYAGAGSNMKDRTGKTAYDYQSRKLSLKKMLYVSGATTNNLTNKMWTYLLDTKGCGENNNLELLQQEMDKLLAEPDNMELVPTLMQASRTCIRNHLSNVQAQSNHSRLIPSLPLPLKMIQYLIFDTDIDFIEQCRSVHFTDQFSDEHEC